MPLHSLNISTKVAFSPQIIIKKLGPYHIIVINDVCELRGMRDVWNSKYYYCLLAGDMSKHIEVQYIYPKMCAHTPTQSYIYIWSNWRKIQNISISIEMKRNANQPNRRQANNIHICLACTVFLLTVYQLYHVQPYTQHIVHNFEGGICMCVVDNVTNFIQALHCFYCCCNCVCVCV